MGRRLLKNPDDLLKASPTLPLGAINDATPEGKQLLASARQILANLGKTDADAITVEDTADTAEIFAQTKFNGDGIVPADAASDDADQGGHQRHHRLPRRRDRPQRQAGRQPGQGGPVLRRGAGLLRLVEEGRGRRDRAAARRSTTAAARRPSRRSRPRWTTTSPAAAWRRSTRAPSALNREEKEYLALAAKDLTITHAEIAGFPLARSRPTSRCRSRKASTPPGPRPSPRSQADVVKPLLGRQDVADRSGLGRLARQARRRIEAWAAGKAGGAVEKLGLKRVREILAGKAKETITALIAKDKALEPEANAIAAVETAGALPPRPVQAAATTSSPSATSTAARTRPSSRPARSTWTSAAATCACGGGRRQARRHGRPGRHLPRLLRLRAQGHRREDADRRRLHRRRFRQPDGRPQRHLLRPQGPRLGRHHHQDRGQPDQHPPGVLVAVQETGPR